MFSFNVPSESWHIFILFYLEWKPSQTVTPISVCALKENPVFLLLEMSVNPTYLVYVTNVQRVLKNCLLTNMARMKYFFPSFLQGICLYQIHPLVSFCINKTGVFIEAVAHGIWFWEFHASRSFPFSKLKYLWELGEFQGVCTR